MKRLTLIIICIYTVTTNYAQSNLKGNVMEIRTDVMLSGIKVENLSNHAVTYTQQRGLFSINAKKGDLICFSGLNYQTDTVYLINLKHLTVLLELRSTQLNEVKVTTNRANPNYYNPTSQTGPFGSHTVLYKPGGGLIFRLPGSTANAKNKKRLAQLELEGKQEREISIMFSADSLKKYIPLTGIELNNFSLKYRPGIKTYFNKRFNLAEYLNDSYKDFLNIPEEKRKSATWLQLNEQGN